MMIIHEDPLRVLISAASVLLAFAAPSAAATRAHQNPAGYGAYASGGDRSGAYYYGPRESYGHAETVVPNRAAPSQPQVQRGQNLPYADRPYGDPDSW